MEPAAQELKTRLGWITCPKDEVVELIDFHCKTPVEACPHFEGRVGNIVYCSYETDKEETQ